MILPVLEKVRRDQIHLYKKKSRFVSTLISTEQSLWGYECASNDEKEVKTTRPNLWPNALGKFNFYRKNILS